MESEQVIKQHFITLIKYELGLKENNSVVVSSEPHTIGFKPTFGYEHKPYPYPGEDEITRMKIENGQLMIGVCWGEFGEPEIWYNAETEEDISISTFEQCLEYVMVY